MGVVLLTPEEERIKYFSGLSLQLFVLNDISYQYWMRPIQFENLGKGGSPGRKEGQPF